MRLSVVSMRMAMDVVSVAVRMRMDDAVVIGTVDRSARHRAQESSNIHQAQDNQHYRDAQLHAESEPYGNDQIEKYDASAHDKNGERVANAPKGPDEGSPHAVALIADDGCHRNDVVGVSGVPHP